MKLLGAILTVLGVYLGLAAHPLFYVLGTVGLLLYIEAIENSIIAHTTEYLRRAIKKNKTYEELRNEKISDNVQQEMPDE